MKDDMQLEMIAGRNVQLEHIKDYLFEVSESNSYIEQYAVSESQAKELVKTLLANDNRLSIDNKLSQTVRSLPGKEK